MIKRRRFKQTVSFQDRLRAFAKEARERAASLPAGLLRDDMLRKARQADTAANLDSWMDSPGLQPPK